MWLGHLYDSIKAPPAEQRTDTTLAIGLIILPNKIRNNYRVFSITTRSETPEGPGCGRRADPVTRVNGYEQGIREGLQLLKR